MGVICIQMGHVPRTRGSTGTHREQEFTRALGHLLVTRLAEAGHRAHLMGADDPVPVSRGDVFIALHGDGSTNPARRGASVGYPGTSWLAGIWKSHHEANGYSGGFLPDNYTGALRGYYMWNRTTRFTHRFLAEHGFLTNAEDEAWLFGNLEACARAHVAAVSTVLGTPVPAPVQPAPVQPAPVQPTPAPPPAPTGGRVAVTVNMPMLREGSSGLHVATLQSAITIKSEGHQPLVADGAFGPKTAAEVRKWQQHFGLGADAIVGPITWASVLQYP